MVILKAILAAIFSAVLGYVRDRQRDADIKAAGRAEAERDGAMAAAERAEAIAAVPEPQDEEVLRRLREGSA